jgi:hypothetical protein
MPSLASAPARGSLPAAASRAALTAAPTATSLEGLVPPSVAAAFRDALAILDLPDEPLDASATSLRSRSGVLPAALASAPASRAAPLAPLLAPAAAPAVAAKVPAPAAIDIRMVDAADGAPAAQRFAAAAAARAALAGAAPISMPPPPPPPQSATARPASGSPLPPSESIFAR